MDSVKTSSGIDSAVAESDSGTDTGEDSAPLGEAVDLSLIVMERWWGDPVVGAVMTGVARGSTTTTDGIGTGTVEVDASAGFEVTLSVADHLDARVVGVTREADLGFPLAWPATDVLDAAAVVAGVTRDPAQGVVVVSILDALNELVPMSWVSGYALSVDVGSEAAFVTDGRGDLTPGNTTLADAPAEIVFLNVPAGTARLQWVSRPGSCATEWLLEGSADTAFPVVSGEITFVQLTSDCD